MPNRRTTGRSFTAPRPLLTEIRTDRATGVLLAAAAGDALGVPYEGKGTMPSHQQPKMLGGGYGPYRPGEYSDDTQMHWCIADVAATGADLRTPSALDAIAGNFLFWLRKGASDVGIQTRTVLGMTEREHEKSDEPLHQVMIRQAAAQYQRTGLGAGNGALMRTGIVALAYLDADPRAMADAARAVSNLTHGDPLSAEACILWCSGIRTAVLEGTFDGVRAGLALLPENRRPQWSAWLDDAESQPPHTFANNNGFVVVALQAAWAAITQTPVPTNDPARGTFTSQHLQLALENAVRIGRDTDTVAAIAGALLGARWGGSAVPLDWQRLIHGWPSQEASDLVSLAVLTVNKGRDDSSGWPRIERMPHPKVDGQPFAVVHPDDPGLVIGNLAQTAVDDAPIDAVVSLCRVGSGPILTQAGVEHVRVWLVDRTGANADPAFVVDQAARIVQQLRQEGKRVFLHCVAGRSRTPAVAARYSCLLTGKSPADALTGVRTALEWWRLDHNRDLFEAVYRLGGHRPPARSTGAASHWAFDGQSQLSW